MVKEWTRKERKEHIGEKYKSLRSKIFVLAVAVIIFLLLLYGVFYAVKTANTDLLVFLIVGLIIFIPVAIFFVDMYWFEFQ